MFERLNKKDPDEDSLLGEAEQIKQRGGKSNEDMMTGAYGGNPSNETNAEELELVIDNIDQIEDFGQGDLDADNRTEGAKNGKRTGTPRQGEKTPQKKKEIRNDLIRAAEEDSDIASEKSNKSKISLNSSSGKIKNQEQQQIDEDMKPIEGWNFDPVKLPERKSAGWGSSLLTRIAY